MYLPNDKTVLSSYNLQLGNEESDLCFSDSQ